MREESERAERKGRRLGDANLFHSPAHHGQELRECYFTVACCISFIEHLIEGSWFYPDTFKKCMLISIIVVRKVVVEVVNREYLDKCRVY